ncbi:STY4534 family ICE replication protein [Billgrantia endophytica]|uniref:DUF3577 domain-containing protein n=1 Tax=Billgrantia endophytica TaxID=2033802 RepID=A0A2N7U4H2_9GAMM|nr:STY4534 family ICE replication protein [Halomonas endophytica]PMR75323.1 hypothetical protein C1H69_10400 [Halomonas endophytica]
MATSYPDTSFFDLHTTGLGYLNRIREVKPRKGEAFLACDIAALNGPSDAPEYRRFDVKVAGSEAQHLVRRCEEAVNAERKVLIGFRLGDMWTDIFTYSKGKRAGELGVSLKARLLFVSWIKVDGKLVYKAAPNLPRPSEREETSPVTPNTAATQDSPATDGGASEGEAVDGQAPALAESS